MSLCCFLFKCYELSAGTARRDGSSTSDVFGKVTPVENIYLLLQNSRHTYAADYHHHAAVCSLVSALRRHCDRVRSEIGRCSAVSELHESDCMFTTTFDSNWLKTDICSVQGGLSAELSRLSAAGCGQRSGSDKATICQQSARHGDPHVYQMSLNSDDAAVI